MDTLPKMDNLFSFLNQFLCFKKNCPYQWLLQSTSTQKGYQQQTSLSVYFRYWLWLRGALEPIVHCPQSYCIFLNYC